MRGSWLTLGLAVVGVAMFVAGCGSAVSQRGSEGSGAGGSGAGGTTSGGGEGGVGGGMGGGTTSGGGEGGGQIEPGVGGAGGAGGGGSAYESCKACLGEEGASANECQAEWDACMQWKTCVSLYHCNTMGFPGGPGPCDTTSMYGGCCALECEAEALDEEGLKRYRALDACRTCKTCGSVCGSADSYCKVLGEDGEPLCIP